MTYTFLLNRFQLSKMNGWVNCEGEVFIIFPREKLADEMGISYRKAISCFKELLAANLIWEQRIGRGNANHIYLASVALSEPDAMSHDSAPFAPRSAVSACLDDIESNTETATGAFTPTDDLPKPQGKKCENGTFKYAEPACPDMRLPHPNKKDFSKKEKSDIDLVSQSRHARVNLGGQVDIDEKLLDEILEDCELDILPAQEAGVFRNAITRLFYSDSFRVGSAILPGQVIRSHLHSLDGLILLDTWEKLRKNTDKQVKNSTAYVMAALLNNIWECKSDLMVDPYLISMNTA